MFDARDQWRGNDGKVVRDPSKALMLIHAADAKSDKNIAALRADLYVTSRFVHRVGDAF